LTSSALVELNYNASASRGLLLKRGELSRSYILEVPLSR
jgi:hypothetical protein